MPSYTPPNVYTTTNFDNPVQGAIDNVKIPVFIGEGNEFLEQRNLEVVRGSSSRIDQQISNEDETGRAVVSVSQLGQVTLGAFNGNLSKFQVRNFPIVNGDGTGTVTTNRTDVSVTINNLPIVVLSVDGQKGIVEIATPPQETDLVRCTYFFKRTDTYFTDDVSDQVTATPALVRGLKGIADVNADNNQGETLVFYNATLNPQGQIVTPANNEVSLLIDNTPYEFILTPGTYTMRQVATLITASNSGSLTASSFINNFGLSTLQLNSDHDITVLDASANALLGIATGQTSNRRKTFYTFVGPIVDGSNGGIVTTDPSKVSVKVDNQVVQVQSVNGSNRAVTLAISPAVGAKVTISYWANTWQDTFDYLAHNDVIDVTACGDVQDSPSYVEEADFILQNDRIHWGTSWSVEAGSNTPNTEFFNETQISGLLIDNKTYLSLCSAVVTQSGGVATRSYVDFQLPFDPTLGNGRDTKLGQSLFQSISNNRIDLPVNRPDVISVYWGFDVQDALDRGQVEVLRIQDSIVTLKSSVPVGAKVYASFYYNQLTDNEYTLSVTQAGISGIGKYTIQNQDAESVYGASFSTGSKGAGLIGVSINWPSGSELTPDLRFESVSGQSFSGPVEETVTVQFASRNATPAKYTVPSPGPYEFISDYSDKFRVLFSGNELAAGVSGLDLDLPAGVSGYDGGFPASYVGSEVEYTGGSGATLGESYTLSAVETVDLFLDGVTVSAQAEATTAVDIDHFRDAINTATSGFQGLADGGGAATIIFPVTTPGNSIPNYYVGWNVTVGNGAAAATAGQTQTITTYDYTTRTATVSVNWTGGAIVATDPFRLYDPDTQVSLKGATRFDSSVTLGANLHDKLALLYVGDVTGSSGTLTADLGNGPFATANLLATEVETQIATQVAGLGAPFAGLLINCTADADGRLGFKLQLPGVDSAGLLTFISAGGGAATDFAVLAGLDTGATVTGGQAILFEGQVARTYIFAHTDGQKPHDRLILRNRIFPGGGGSLSPQNVLDQCQLEIGSGSGNTKAALLSGALGEAGYTATVRPASINGFVSLTLGQDVVTAEPQVIFYDGTGSKAANNVLQFNLDLVPITVTFTASSSGTATNLGPATGASNGSVLDQIIDAIAAAPGAPFGNASAVFTNLIVRQEGSGIRVTSTRADVDSTIVIGSGSANSALGFTSGQAVARDLVSTNRLVSALNSNRNSSLTTAILTFTSATANYFTGSGRGIAVNLTDEVGAEYLYMQSLPTSGAGYGTASSITVRDPTIAGVVTDSWLTYNTGINALDLDGSVGDPAISGFFVISNQTQGSGSVNTSVLNNGTGQDGIVGQTYRDLVTGLTFTILPRGFQDNEDGPWQPYPTGGTATFRVNVSKTFTTDANIPHNSIPGLELRVSNTSGIGVGDTALVKTFERGGNEPAIGDVYYVTYTYRKQVFQTAIYSQMSAVEDAYGQISPDNPVSLAAYLAIQNGASLIAIRQVPREEGSNYASLETYSAAIAELEGALPGNIRPSIIVPLRGDSVDLFQVLKRSNEIQSSPRYRSERISIVGLSAGTTPNTAISTARSLASDRMRVMYPDIATVRLTDAFNNTREYLVDGPMIAAAMAGSVVNSSLDVATPWVGRNLVGFASLARILNDVQMNDLAQNGITVVESRPPFLHVRDGRTTDTSSDLKVLPTIRLIADEVQQQTRSVLEPFIGIKYLPTVLTQIEGRLATLLKNLVQNQIITAYTGVKATMSPSDPTAIDVVAFYSPVFPIRYIRVQFSIRSSL